MANINKNKRTKEQKAYAKDIELTHGKNSNIKGIGVHIPLPKHLAGTSKKEDGCIGYF